MPVCTLCHFAVPLDDVVVRHAAGRCVCLRCYGRETGSAKPMPKALRRDVIAALAALEAAWAGPLKAAPPRMTGALRYP